MEHYFEDRYELLDDDIYMSIYENNAFTFRAHWHMEVEVIYVAEGSILIGVNQEKRRVQAGEFVFCRGGDIHYYHALDQAKVILMVFKPDYFGLDTQWPKDKTFLNPFIKKNDLSLSVYNRLVEIMYNLLDEKTHKRTCYTTMVKGLILEFCSLCERSIQTQSCKVNVGQMQTLKDILTFIEDHYSEPLSLKGLAGHFNVDPYNLSKQFNVVTGNNLKKYINKLRIKKAERLIKETDYKLIEIAMMCGFDSIRTFNRTFKTINGGIPSSLRK